MAAEGRCLMGGFDWPLVALVASIGGLLGWLLAVFTETPSSHDEQQ